MLTGILILIEIDQVSPSNPLVCWQLQRVVVGVRLFQGDHSRVQTQHTDSLKIEHRGGDTASLNGATKTTSPAAPG